MNIDDSTTNNRDMPADMPEWLKNDIIEYAEFIEFQKPETESLQVSPSFRGRCRQAAVSAIQTEHVASSDRPGQHASASDNKLVSIEVSHGRFGGNRLARPVMLMAAAGAIAATVVLLVPLFSPAAVSAKELLTRASAAQMPSVMPAEQNRNPIVYRENPIAYQRVQVIADGVTSTREYRWSAGNRKECRWNLMQPWTEWKAPLSADGFTEWRDSVINKLDKISGSGEMLTLETTTGSYPIRRASLTVRAGDFHPVQLRIRFADDHELELTEIAFQIRIESVAPRIESTEVSRSTVPVETNLAEVEINLRYALFIHGWDLDETIIIYRAGDEVIVSGAVSGTEQATQLRDVLASIRNVRIQIRPLEDTPQAHETPSPEVSTTLKQVPLLERDLDSGFSSMDQRQAFVRQLLSASNEVVELALATKQLGQRYTEPEVRLLSNQGRRKLREILVGHLTRLIHANAGVSPLVNLLLGDGPPRTISPSADDWRTESVFLSEEADHQAHFVTELTVSGSVEASLPTVESFFLSAHRSIDLLAHEALRLIDSKGLYMQSGSEKRDQ